MTGWPGQANFHEYEIVAISEWTLQAIFIHMKEAIHSERWQEHGQTGAQDGNKDD
jgi:hypothetical protein